MKIKGAIFDFDGTLFDSMSIWETAGADFLRSIGIAPKKNLWLTLKSMSLLQSAEYLKNEYELPLTIDEIINGINQTVADFYLYRAMPKKNAAEFLTALQDNGVKMCIATATDRHLIEAALKRCNMLHFFEEIFTCTEVGCGKDKPHIYNRALDFLATDKCETVVFEDACYAVHTARNADFLVAGVFDRYELQQDKLKELADIYLTDFFEIGEIL